MTAAVRVAGLRGRNLELVEHRVLKRLAQAGVKLGTLRAGNHSQGYAITEDFGLYN